MYALPEPAAHVLRGDAIKYHGDRVAPTEGSITNRTRLVTMCECESMNEYFLIFQGQARSDSLIGHKIRIQTFLVMTTN